MLATQHLAHWVRQTPGSRKTSDGIHGSEKGGQAYGIKRFEAGVKRVDGRAVRDRLRGLIGADELGLPECSTSYVSLESTCMRHSFPRLASLVLPVLVYGAAIAYVYVKDQSNLQNWAVVLTGLVVIWYTWETRELRIASYLQIESQVRPYVVLQQENGAFQVTNFGNGVALHTRLDSIVVSEEHQFEIRFPKAVAVLRPGESAEVEARSYKSGKDAGVSFNAHIDPQHANQELDVTLHFDDIELKNYSITQHVSPGKVVVAMVQ